MKDFSVPTIRFFKTIYPLVDFGDVPTKEDAMKVVEHYLEQPNNGEWVDVDLSQLVYTNNKKIDIDWVNRQMVYTSTLPKRDILTVASYGHKGDSIINFYKRGELDRVKFLKLFDEEKVIDDGFNYMFFRWHRIVFPFFPQYVDVVLKSDVYSFENYERYLKDGARLSDSTWNEILDLFIKDLERIFDNAPEISQDIKVWRGSNSSHMFNYRTNKKNPIYISSQFLSTTYDIKVTFDFMGDETITTKKGKKESTCCLLEINVPAGTRPLLLIQYTRYVLEFEILLKHNTPFVILDNDFLNFDDRLYAVTRIELIKKVNVVDDDTFLKSSGFGRTNLEAEIRYLRGIV